jgi:hypothetical protein
MEGIYMSYNSKEVTLPSGATVVIKDARMLLVRDRNKVLECAGEKEGVMQAVGMQNGLIAVMVESWSFDLLPPNVRLDSIEELTPLDYEKLLEEALPAQTALFPSLTVNETNVNDPKASTANFNA